MKARQRRNIGVFVRAVILKNNRLLVCRHKDAPWYFLPGGEMQFGESANQAISREIKEELNTSAKIGKFIGAVESSFRENNHQHQEVNLVFTAALRKNTARSAEAHLEFEWLDLRKLVKVRLLPAVLKEQLAKWLVRGDTFWSSNLRT